MTITPKRQKIMLLKLITMILTILLWFRRLKICMNLNGVLALMRHAPNYGPYENMEKRKYYKHFYRSDLISCEGTNNGIIKTNIDYTYSIIKDIPTGNYVRYRWSIIDGKEDDATGNDKATLDYNEKNPSAIINIKQPGLYTINCEIYLSTTGEVLGDAMYQPLVEN